MRTMLIAATFIALCTAPVYPGAAHAQASAAGSSAGAPAFGLPKWRLQVQPYRSSYDGGISLGVYRRLGARWDLGLQLSSWAGGSDFDARDRDTNYEDELEYTRVRKDRENYRVTLYLDFRRWQPLSQRLAWFAGPQLKGGYSKSTREEDSRRTAEERSYSSWRADENWGFDTGIALSVGADLTLVRSLSCCVLIRPIGLSYSWGESEHQEERQDTRYDGVRTSSGANRDEDFAVSTSLSAEVYLSLHL